MDSDRPKITTQPEMQWRVIPGFPDYEMNMLEEVRHIAAKRPRWETPQDGRYIRLWKGGRMQSISALELARRTFPELHDRREYETPRHIKHKKPEN